MDKTNGVNPQISLSSDADRAATAAHVSSVAIGTRERFTGLLNAPALDIANGSRQTSSNSGAQAGMSSEDAGTSETTAMALNTSMLKGAEEVVVGMKGQDDSHEQGAESFDMTSRLWASAEALATPTAASLSAGQRESGAITQDELTNLLQRHCSDIYVSDPHSGNGRLLLGIDATLPGAAVEFVRDGAFLRVRLHIRDEDVFRRIDAEREHLVAALNRTTPLQVSVDVVRRSSTQVDPS